MQNNTSTLRPHQKFSYLGCMKTMLYSIPIGVGKAGFNNTMLVEVWPAHNEPVQYEVVSAPFGAIAAEEMDYLDAKYPGCCLVF